jgi:hypothetical protein
MTDAATTTTASDTTTTAATTTATTTTAKPWYEGKADGELLGHMQTLGWHTKSPEDAAIEAAKAHREARSYIGMPETRLLKLPADPTKDTDGMRAVFQRLGAPKEAKEYDFANVKFSDGTAIDAAFDAAIRNALFDANVPKDAAGRLAQSMVKYFDDADKAEDAERSASITEARTNLAKNWGKNFEANKFIAGQAAQKLGISPETVDAMEKNIGYDKVMDAFLQIGLKTGEARYVAGENPANGGIMTLEQAKAELSNLENDKEFGKRLFAGDAAAKRQHQALLTILHDEKAA